MYLVRHCVFICVAGEAKWHRMGVQPPPPHTKRHPPLTSCHNCFQFSTKKRSRVEKLVETKTGDQKVCGSILGIPITFIRFSLFDYHQNIWCCSKCSRQQCYQICQFVAATCYLKLQFRCLRPLRHHCWILWPNFCFGSLAILATFKNLQKTC